MSTAAEIEQPGASLLDDLSTFIRRYVALSGAQADVLALWVVHTHAIAAADITPYAQITSALPRSGKSTLLELLALLAARPWLTGRVTAGSLVRKIHAEQPTLLLDESDAAFQGEGKYAEALRGVLNSGFSRSGVHSMNVAVGNNWNPTDFRTFCPKAIAGIGNLPDTVTDRSIQIKLKRKKRSERLERFRRRRVLPVAEALKVRVSEWANANVERLRNAEPDMPEELNDRQQDVCEPLVAIAECAGGEWPQRLGGALVSICTGSASSEPPMLAMLLADIRSIFERVRVDRISSKDLLDNLNAEDSPWAEYDRGKPLTASGLARLLKGLEICPRDIRFENRALKGYYRADFEDAWARYIPALYAYATGEGQHARQAAIHTGPASVQEGQQTSDVAGSNRAETPANLPSVADVAPSESSQGQAGST